MNEWIGERASYLGHSFGHINFKTDFLMDMRKTTPTAGLIWGNFSSLLTDVGKSKLFLMTFAFAGTIWKVAYPSLFIQLIRQNCSWAALIGHVLPPCVTAIHIVHVDQMIDGFLFVLKCCIRVFLFCDMRRGNGCLLSKSLGTVDTDSPQTSCNQKVSNCRESPAMTTCSENPSIGNDKDKHN